MILLLVGEVLACLSLSIRASGWRRALVIFFTVATVVPELLVAVDAPGAVGTLLVLALVVSPIMVYLLLGLVCCPAWPEAVQILARRKLLARNYQLLVGELRSHRRAAAVYSCNPSVSALHLVRIRRRSLTPSSAGTCVRWLNYAVPSK